ncbi:MAG: 1-deoxy-D-xylulose-5-phosphate synthase [Candidatus Eisenbacteria bacterium]
MRRFAETGPLDDIKGPEDLKELTLRDLNRLAREIRERIISVVSETGGHLAPSLGVVELTIALHYCFDSPRDKIVWDVGHQAYAHKILTGRRDAFRHLRMKDGISGFPKIDESDHDAFGTGHASTSISAALGMACARDLSSEDYHVLAVIGDGALTGGMAFEGLNQAGHLKKDLIVILNDNKMSISRNVGALSQYLTRLISAPVYRRFEADVWELLGKIPTVGGRARSLGGRIKESLKNLVVPGILFEELGFRYYGPVDGHNIEQVIHVLNHIKEFNGPQILHVVTTKGKGYTHAEKNATKFHGIGTFDKKTGKLEKSSDFPSYTQVFGKTITELGTKHDRVVAITAAMPDGTGLTRFRDKFPERFFDVGIAEQHAVTFAAGIARAGFKPIVAVYSTFLQRAFDQIVHDVALQRLNVGFAIDRGGLVGEDGPTHHGAFDLSYLGQVPNLVVMAPKDENEFRHMLATMVVYEGGPIAVRYPRDYGYGVKLDKKLRALEIGKGELIASGGDVALVGIGSMVEPCRQAAEILAGEGISCSVVNARFAKPLDRELLTNVASQVKLVVTVEENAVRGGFGSAVCALLSECDINVPVTILGLPDRFVSYAARHELLEEVGLSREAIARSVVTALSRCR